MIIQRVLTNHKSRIFNSDLFILGTIIFVAFCLRLNEIGLSLPYFYTIDEEEIVFQSLRMIADGDFNPHYFLYGGFFYYLMAAIFWAYLKIHALFFSDAGLISAGLNIHAIDFYFYYLGKFAALIFSLINIGLTYLIAGSLFNKKVAKLSAFFFALIPIDIFTSQQAKVDTCLVCWVLLTTYFSLKLLKEGDLKYYILSGIALGLAVGTKWVFPVFLPVLVAHLFRINKDKSWKSAFFDYRIYLSAYLAFLVFFLTNPYFFLSFPEVLSTLQVARSDMQILNDIMSGYFIRFFRELLIIFPVIFSPFLYVAALTAIPIIWKNESKPVISVFLSFPFLFLIVYLSLYKSAWPHHFLPVMPFFVLSGSYLIIYLWQKPARKLKIIGHLIFFTTLIFFLSDLVMPHYRQGFTIYRELGKWVEEKIPNRNSVILSHILLDPTPRMKKLVTYYDNPNDLSEEMIRILNPEYFILMEFEPVFSKSVRYKKPYQVSKDLRHHDFPYIIEKEFIYHKYLVKLVSLLLDLKDFVPNYVVYRRERVYSVADKIDFIGKVVKEKDNESELKRVRNFIYQLDKKEQQALIEEMRKNNLKLWENM